MPVGKPIKDIRLVVRERGWGDAYIENIITLLNNTVFHINQYLRIPFDETIHVHPAPVDDYIPRVLYRNSPNDPYIIRLTSRDCYWAQYTYQFAHEFCHVLSNYEQLQNNPNKWFHEAICELASMFTIRHMAEQWHIEPPYNEWRSFAHSLETYWKEWMFRDGTQLPEGDSLYSWLLNREDMLRVNDIQEESERIKQSLIAYQLLPIFEETPTGWNAIRKLPTSEGYLKDYLMDWYSLVDAEDKPFVERISDAFGYTIT